MIEQYDQLMDKPRQPKSIVQFFRQSPLLGIKFDCVARPKVAHFRDVDLSRCRARA
jgi:hypothetical protein